MTTTSMPKPGPQQETVDPTVLDPTVLDPDVVRAEVAELLSEMSGATPIGQRARVLERAHDVLVHALGTVDKI